MFPSDNINECCYERYELRVGSKLFARGDGEEFEAWSSKDRAIVKRYKKNEPDIGKLLLAEARAMNDKAAWSTVLTLRFLILPIKSVMGLWSFSTKGEASSIPAIIAAYDSVLNYAKTVVGVPFDLNVEMVKSQKPDSESRFPVVKLVPNLGVAHLNMLHDLIDHGRTFHKVLTADVIEKEVAALPAPEAAHG